MTDDKPRIHAAAMLRTLYAMLKSEREKRERLAEENAGLRMELENKELELEEAIYGGR